MLICVSNRCPPCLKPFCKISFRLGPRQHLLQAAVNHMVTFRNLLVSIANRAAETERLVDLPAPLVAKANDAMN